MQEDVLDVQRCRGGVRSLNDAFTVGICATGDSPDLAELARLILSQADMAPQAMHRLIIVASDCPSETLSALKELQQEDHRVSAIVEERRHGKAEAINRILGMTKTPYVIFANSDSRPEAGAISSLLSTARSDKRVGAVSAIPITDRGQGVVSLLVNFMWSAHNRCSLALNHMNVSNHSCDELVLFRTSAISSLPRNTVNDGAYLAATARLHGFSVKVSMGARVMIKTPTRITDVIRQRRRIIFGHVQVWQRLGTPPKTVESLLFLSPLTGVKLLASTLAESPRALLVFPIAMISETAAAFLSILDTLRSTPVHAVWRRFAS